MGKLNFEKPFQFRSFIEIFYCDMTRLRNTILNYCGLCQQMKAIKPMKIEGQGLFKNQLNFKISINFITVT